MKFGNPPMLLIALATLLLLGMFLVWAWRKRQRDIILFVHSRLLALLTVGVSKMRQKIRLALVALAAGCILLALARPQWGFTLEEIKQAGLDIVVAIDVSRSMLTRDVRPDRLTRAKLAALELIPLAKTDRLGLVAFAGTAFLQCPLTLDEEAYRQSVNAIEFGIIPQGGTEITSAIDTAVAAFKNDEQHEKVIVLITDGENHEYIAAARAAKAAQTGIRLFTIGIGTAQGELVPQGEGRANAGFFKDEEGNVVQSHLNETLLREIAEKGRGFYLPLQGATTMDTLYQRGLAPLLGDLKLAAGGRTGKNTPRLLRRFQERFQWPLSLALVLLLTEMLLPDRKIARRAEPAQATPALLQNQRVLLLVLGLIWGTEPVLQASPNTAKQLFDRGKYEDAWKEYKNLFAHDPKDSRLAFNAGVSAYQAKKFDQAYDHFNEALMASNLQLQEQAYYNLGNTLYRLGESAGEPKETTQLWDRSLKSYEDALKLNPKDADAQFNRQFVQKRLEELKQQQQQQQQQNQSSDDSQKKKDSQSKDKPEQQPNESNQPPPSPPDSSPGKDSPTNQPPKPENAKDSAQNQPPSAQDQTPKPADKKEPAGADSAKPQDQPAGQTNQMTGQAVEGQMTPEQVRQLLEAQKGEERIYVPRFITNGTPRKFKDW
jgi:Ca-activated chloride channel homolog